MTDREVEQVYWNRYKNLHTGHVWNLPLQEELVRESIRFQGDQGIEDEGLQYVFTTNKTFLHFQGILCKIDGLYSLNLLDETYKDMLDYSPDGRGGLFATGSTETSDVCLEYSLDDTLIVDYLGEHMHGQITVYEASQRSSADYEPVRALLGAQ